MPYGKAAPTSKNFSRPKRTKGGPGKRSKMNAKPQPRITFTKKGRSAFNPMGADQDENASINPAFPAAQTSTPSEHANLHGNSFARGHGSPIEPENPFPMRINKYLSHIHKMTRKTADILIEKRQIKINGKIAVLGDKVVEDDVVAVEQKELENMRKDYAYFAYNKPSGIVTHSPEHDEMDIKQILMKNSSLPPHITKSLFPVGRLDKKSIGLIILTNDGRVTDRLLNPDYVHDKEYVVTTVQELPHFFKKHMEAGIQIGQGENGYKTKPAKIDLMAPNVFGITLTEGKRHQIRRMCEALRVDVRELKRIRVMNIRLGKLAPNTTRRIDGKELEDFLKSLGL